MAGLLDMLGGGAGGGDVVLLDDLRRKRLAEMRHNLSLRGRDFSTGATPEDATMLQEDINQDPDTGLEAQKGVANIEAAQAGEAAFNSPGATGVRQQKQKDELAKMLAVPQQEGANALALEHAKTEGAIKIHQDKNEGLMKLFQGPSASTAPTGALNSGAPGSYKMDINAGGDPTFKMVQQPALVQRAQAQLSEAHQEHLKALSEAERLWPGINDAATEADKGTAPGLGGSLLKMLGGVTGMGAQKYAGPGDAAALASETARYRLRQPTALSNFIQKASFGNLEQMAGQLPGVRGLATVVPLFREHQTALTSNNPGTPLASVQRLRHLIDSEEHALQEMSGQMSIPGQEEQ